MQYKSTFKKRPLTVLKVHLSAYCLIKVTIQQCISIVIYSSLTVAFVALVC